MKRKKQKNIYLKMPKNLFTFLQQNGLCRSEERGTVSADKISEVLRQKCNDDCFHQSLNGAFTKKLSQNYPFRWKLECSQLHTFAYPLLL